MFSFSFPFPAFPSLSAYDFQYPYVLFLLLLIPLLFWWSFARDKRSKGFGFPTLKGFRHYTSSHAWMNDVPKVLRLLLLIFLVLASARPLGGNIRQLKQNDGLDILLVLDTSQSMLAMDFKLNNERRNRLDVVKEVVGDFVIRRADDRIGLVVFGTEAFTQAPLTMDHQVLQQFLKHISIGMAGPDTAIGDGLAAGIKRLKDVPAPSKVLILLTDGDNTAGSIDPLEAAQLAKTLGIKVYTIAVGTNEPVPFPVQGFFGTEYRSQVFKVNTELLQKIADLTGGKSFTASTTERLKEVYQTIDRLEKSKQEWENPVEREELAYIFLYAALILFGLEQLWHMSRFRVVP